MADRKVLNKYFPPDFDPDKLWKNKRFLKDSTVKPKGKGTRQMEMRMMFPFTVCCSACYEFTYVGTKFNSRVEMVRGEDYLGISVWRFLGRCPNCRNEIAFKTDPKNGDYTLEWGGTRTYDAAKDSEKAQDALKQHEEAELEGDRMKQIEAKTYNTQRELQSLEELDEIRQINKRFLDRNSSADMALRHIQSTPNLEPSVSDEEEVQNFKYEIEQNQSFYSDDLNSLSEDEDDSHKLNSSINQKHSSSRSRMDFVLETNSKLSNFSSSTSSSEQSKNNSSTRSLSNYPLERKSINTYISYDNSQLTCIKQKQTQKANSTPITKDEPDENLSKVRENSNGSFHFSSDLPISNEMSTKQRSLDSTSLSNQFKNETSSIFFDQSTNSNTNPKFTLKKRQPTTDSTQLNVLSTLFEAYVESEQSE